MIMEYSISIERMEAVVAPGILDAIGSFFQGLVDGLANGLIF